MKAMKFIVHSKEHSIALQNKLFELGYEWMSGKKEPFTICNIDFLYTDEEGYITHNSDVIRFNDDKGIKSTLDDLYKMAEETTIIIHDKYKSIINRKEETVFIGSKELSFTEVKRIYNAIK